MSQREIHLHNALDLLADLVAEKVAARLGSQVEPVAVQQVPAPKTEASEPEEPVAEEPSTGGASVEEVRAMFVELGKEMGRDAQVSVLKEFNAKKLSEVEPEKFGSVVGVIGAMLKEHRDGV